MSFDLRPLNISRVSYHTFLLALATPVTSLEPHLGGRILVPVGNTHHK